MLQQVYHISQQHSTHYTNCLCHLLFQIGQLDTKYKPYRHWDSGSIHLKAKEFCQTSQGSCNVTDPGKLSKRLTKQTKNDQQSNRGSGVVKVRLLERGWVAELELLLELLLEAELESHKNFFQLDAAIDQEDTTHSAFGEVPCPNSTSHFLKR